jgi:hypothetical protein
LHEFAKLYWAEDTGQVLVTLEGHCVQLRFAMPGAVSSVLRLDFDDTPDGDIRAQGLFSRFDRESTLAEVREFMNQPELRGLFPHPKGCTYA